MGERNGDERRKRSRRVVRAREKGDKVGHLHRQALVAGETTCETLRLQIRRSPPSLLSGALAPGRVPVGEPQPAASPSPQSRSCASLPHSGSRAAPPIERSAGARIEWRRTGQREDALLTVLSTMATRPVGCGGEGKGQGTLIKLMIHDYDVP